MKVGVWLTQQHVDMPSLRRAWRNMDELGVESIWVWDHFFPLTGDPEGRHFEGWSLLAAMAVETSRARIGVLVSNHEFRNPELLADQARTVDHLSGGRVVLGLGAGWFERDYLEYGIPFRSGPERARSLGSAVHRIEHRLTRLNPPPLGPLPLLIAGDGQQVVLRLVAEHARIWNTMAGRFAEGNAALDEWCRRIGRDPREIERTCFVTQPPSAAELAALREAGAEQIILQLGAPFDPNPVRDLLRAVAEPALSAGAVR